MTPEVLIKENMPLIKHIASNFYNVPYEDLLQAGTVGLLKAYKNYRENGTTKFSSYAFMSIYGEMYAFVNKNRPIKISKEIIKLAKDIEKTRNALSLKLGYVPSYEEVAKFLNLSFAQVMEAVYASCSVLSLDQKTPEEHDYYETIAAKETISLDDKLTLKEGISTLPEREQKIILYRYYKDLSQSETARRLHMNQVMVSRYEKKSLERLREYYEVV